MVEKEYDLLEIEFALIDSLIAMRKKANLTQEEVAKRMGTKMKNIERLERGYTNPEWKTLKTYANACGFEMTLVLKIRKLK